MPSLKSKSQLGIAALEAAGFMAVIAVLGFGLFAIAEVVLTRYAVDSVVEATLSESASLQTQGRIAKQQVTGDGEIEYSYNLDRAQELVDKTARLLNDLRGDRSFLKNLPFNFIVSIYQLSIDEIDGKPVGFVGNEIRKSDGSLSVPALVQSRHSISKTHSEVTQLTSNGVSLYAEPTGMVIYVQNSKKYLPFVPILTICLYVSDKMVEESTILESVFPRGVVANCQAIKVRDFI